MKTGELAGQIAVKKGIEKKGACTWAGREEVHCERKHEGIPRHHWDWCTGAEDPYECHSLVSLRLAKVDQQTVILPRKAREMQRVTGTPCHQVPLEDKQAVCIMACFSLGAMRSCLISPRYTS